MYAWSMRFYNFIKICVPYTKQRRCYLNMEHFFHKFCEVEIVIWVLGSKFMRMYKTCFSCMYVHETPVVHKTEHLVRVKCVSICSLMDTFLFETWTCCCDMVYSNCMLNYRMTKGDAKWITCWNRGLPEKVISSTVQEISWQLCVPKFIIIFTRALRQIFSRNSRIQSTASCLSSFNVSFNIICSLMHFPLKY